MAYFAKIDNHVVTQVIAVNNKVLGEPQNKFPQTESIGVDFIKNTLGLDGEWRQTSYNNSFRGRYAGIGYTYDNIMDLFIPPKQFESWVLDMSNLMWIPPIEKPNDGKLYDWDESTVSWREVVNDPV